jgi:hypothetical protein
MEETARARVVVQARELQPAQERSFDLVTRRA